MLPPEVWDQLPPRHICRYHLLAMRQLTRHELLLMRLQGCKVDDPTWLTDEPAQANLTEGQLVREGDKTYRVLSPG